MEKSSLVKNIQRAALIIGVMIIPLMYSYFYLNAFWDPYQRLDKVPVAVVNMDEGAVINGEDRNLGDEIVDNLKEDASLDFSFTSAEKAKKGVLGNEYYASITIPKDFSSNAATVGEDTKKLHSKIIYSANQRRNYLAAQILENAMPKIKERVNSKIDKQIVETISGRVKEVPEQLGTLDDGLIKLDDGAFKLKKGTAKLSNGANVLAQGLAKLNGNVPVLKNGAGQLNTGAGKLNKGMKKITGNSKALNSGASKVAGGAGELKSGLKSYTDGVDQAGSGAAQLKSGVKQYTDGVDKAGQGASNLTSGLSEYTQGVSDAAAGAKKLKAGLSQVSSGVSALDSSVNGDSSTLGQLISGANSVNNGIGTIKSSVSQAQAALEGGNTEAAKQILSGLLSDKGIPAVQTGAQNLSSGLSQFQSGMSEGIGKLKGAVGDEGSITQGAAALETGLSTLQSNNDKLNGGAKQLSSGLDTLSANNDSLNGGASALDSGLSTLSSNNDKLNSGAEALKSGSDKLESGVSAYTKGVGTAQKGAKQLADGTAKLIAKLPALVTGVDKLDNGAGQLASGAKTLDDGTGKLKDGISTASEGVSTAVGKANTEVKKLDGLPGYAKEPVKTKTEYVQPVENYGSAFAPYFMGLSLWVGGLLIFFGLYFDYSRRIKMLSQESTRVIARALAFGAVSVGQGILLAFVIKSVLHIAVRNPFALYWSSILVAMTFTAIIMFCIINLKDIGKFIVMLLLILQLTSCAGTFPIETQNAFFRAINPFLPMTYSTQLFKEAISGTMGTNAANSALILLSFFAGFMALTMILSHKKIKKDIKHIAQDAKAHAA